MSEDNRQAEADDKMVATFEFRGEKFTVPLHRPDWSLSMIEALEDGKEVALIRGALGPEQWRTVQGMNLKMRGFAELAGATALALGFGSSGE